jgi:hemoglobin
MRAIFALFIAALLSLTSAFAGDTLFERLGGREGLTRIAGVTVDYAVADPAIGPYFKDTNVPRLKGLLAAQFCQVTGGGCKYAGRDMATAHAKMNIDDHAFNRLVELLQLAMDAEGISFGTQNEFLALLAPMHPDVVNK